MLQCPRIRDERGSLTPIEESQGLPFSPKRVFYIYDVPTSEGRGGHAHINLSQFLLALTGNVQVSVTDGNSSLDFHLRRPWEGLLIPPMFWAEEKHFSSGACLLVICSDEYDESDYVRDWDSYLGLSRPSL